MTDDPEITDPRDPHKRPDIVTELDRWLDTRGWEHARRTEALLRRARDEIVALRAQHVEVVEFDLVRHARDQALEEAAQVCISLVRGFPQCGIAASAIRKLKDKGPAREAMSNE